MKKIFLTFALALAILASVFVCESVFAQSVYPWDVVLSVEYRGDVFEYKLSDNIGCADTTARGIYLGQSGKQDLYRRLKSLGLPDEAVYNYILPNFDSITAHFAYVRRERADASVQFDKKGFHYQNGQDGVAIDAQKLFEKALTSCGKLLKITLPLNVDRAMTVDELKANTVRRATFGTSFANSGANRSYNIAKAVDALNGTIVEAGEKFSFNQIVGDRTEARGYKTSKVIMDGAYAEGVGGGVCQVSTTLYNALLLSSFLPCAMQHSLVSSYVKAGFDAMVSYGSADLTFVNTTEHPVYISAWVKDKNVYFSVYGEPNPYTVERVSVETRDKFATNYIVDEQKYPDLVYADQTKVVVGGSDGVKTKSFLKYYRDGKLVCTKLIRTNSYKRVDAVIARGPLTRETPETEG